ncbi:MAG: hypothetical protein WCQ72_06505 [Eubacteriales bacterium]
MISLISAVCSVSSVVSPCTNDSTSFPWLIVVCVVSVAAIAALVIWGKKRK